MRNRLRVAALILFLLFAQFAVQAQTSYEGLPISDIEIVLESSRRQETQQQIVKDQFVNIVDGVLGDKFSAVKNREALQALFDSKRVASARIEVVESQTPARSVILRFVIQRTTLVDRARIEVADSVGEKVSEEELLVRLNLLTTNAVVNERAVQQSADAIQTYLRERGFYKARVEFNYKPESLRESRSNVTFQVNPGEQARVGNFEINVKGFDAARVADDLKLKKGEFYSRAKLTADVERIRRELVKDDFLAAKLQDPFPPNYDPETNTVNIKLNGNVNAKVTVRVEDETGKAIKFGERTERQLFPIKREGEIDRSAIEEGVRRLRTKFQEDGYFFANVEAVCSVDPFLAADANIFRNNTNAACDFLDGLNLEGRKIDVVYKVELSRRFKLSAIRIEGTDKLPVEEVKPALQSQEANILGIIPRLGYGRGITSREILDDDDRVVTSLMRELGYRNADVRVRQGVSPTGEDLIITFVVTEGALTRVSEVEINGNTKFSDGELSKELPELAGLPFSRVRTRTGRNRILDVYARNGFIEAKADFAVIELPSANKDEELVKIVYDVTNEGSKNIISRIRVFGNEKTKEKSILDTLVIAPGDVLRADKLTESERNLSQTDAFREITVTTEAAGETADGNARREVIVELLEQQPREIRYGGGVSSDDGASGFFSIRHFNLFGRLYQGGAQVRASRRQQQFQVDFTNPRFLRESDDKFAPLTVSAQFLRDTGITRFFRTTLDRGTFGIVQRLDANGNPIDQFGADTGVPSINRLTFNVETSRTIDRKTRSLLFVRYRFENVTIANFQSLLVAPILQPDRNVRISGLGATFARDTRENCNNKRGLLERIRTGEAGNPCQYNAADPTRGEFLSLDYQLSARFLGGNTSFNRLSATYQRYFQFDSRFGKIVLAGRVILGLSNIFQPRDRNGNGIIDDEDKSLPISERFFGGGSTTLRGFAFEEAGPRRVVVPQGEFRNRDNKPITLNPFTIPIGGNALAVTTFEARVPITNIFQIVPFYEGGNVFRRTSEIFKPRTVAAGDIEAANLRAVWGNTFGLGLRAKTPFGTVAVDYGYLTNPPQFLIPQSAAPPAIYRLQPGHLHFRFTQAF